MQKQLEIALSSFIKDSNKSKSYIKASDYKDEISNVEIDKNIIRASVRGNRLYKVTLKLDKDIYSHCTCPVDFETCKHSIALAIHMKDNMNQYLEAECDKLAQIYKNKRELSKLTKANLISIIDQLINLNKVNAKYFSSLINEPNDELINSIFLEFNEEVPIEYEDRYEDFEAYPDFYYAAQELVSNVNKCKNIELLEKNYRETIVKLLNAQEFIEADDAIEIISKEHSKCIKKVNKTNKISDFLFNFSNEWSGDNPYV